MPATTIHFVRHGKVENPGHLLYERLPGFHLSEVGVRMAQATAHYIAVIIEARNEFRGTRIGYGEGALWKNGNWKLVRNLWKPSWGESYQSIAHRVQAFALEKVGEHPGEQIIVVSHESPIWSYRHMLETGHPEHNMLLRHTALASITSITYDCDTRKVLSIAYVDPAADVK